jgi:Wings apart-like protein regulation of heterochromatin
MVVSISHELATKCMEPAFRMHLRAHSTLAKFFQALKDAPTKAVCFQTVTQCTSTLTCSTRRGDFNDRSDQWSWDKCRLDALKKVDCLRVLENVCSLYFLEAFNDIT